MQLFILGPAFELPSIDAKCLAAVALLQLLAGGDESEQWSIISTHEQPSQLPYLVTSDGKTIYGFHSIVRHLQPSQELSSQQTADATAISSFLETHAQTLLDISLYVAFENYVTTRSAFTRILPWYANYTLPPSFRAAARTRTAHLGIASLDVEDDPHGDLSNKPAGLADNVGREPQFQAETQQRASMLLGGGKKTVRSLLRQPEHAAAFKLHALTENLFEPLDDMLGESEFFLGRSGQPGPLDCFVYGYLALMFFPALPQSWLAKTLRRKFGRLVRFTEKMHERLGLKTNVEDVVALSKCRGTDEVTAMRKAIGMNLPWAIAASPGALEVTRSIAQDLISRIPLFNDSTKLVPSNPSKQSVWRKNLPIILGATATSLGLLGYYAFATGLLVWPHGEAVQVFGKRRLADYGHLGAALAGISMMRPQSNNYDTGSHGNGDAAGLMNVQVEVDKDR